MSQTRRYISRRQFIQGSATVTAAVLVAACTVNITEEAVVPAEEIAQVQSTNPPTASTQATETVPPPATEVSSSTPTIESPLPSDTPTLEPTPACDDHDETPQQTEGPYFTPNSPERTSLLGTGITGTKLIVSGRVLTPTCETIADALLDFWQCDDNGQYDNAGYRLRGHQFTDQNGNYWLETIVPGLYPGRTRHIHVKVQKPNGAVLTSQLYFPDEPSNGADGIFNPALVMRVEDTGDGRAATFDFVLA
jgi:protocatechuate 3,4-dioxygenase beta subunit